MEIDKSKYCDADDCDNIAHARGWCNRHYLRWMTHGDPLGGGSKCYENPEESFEARTMWEPNSGCLIWLGSVNNGGYGNIWVNGKNIRCHRYSWTRTNGKIPPQMYVLHKCDNRLCVNPHHLFLGTHQDNMDDRDAKGRGDKPKGEANNQAKLTDLDIVNIRSDSRTHTQLAHEYKVSRQNIGLIKRHKTWKHV